MGCVDAAHPFTRLKEVVMKRKNKSPVKPRNRESKNRNVSLSRTTECRHMWMEGYCVKCGIPQPQEPEEI